MKLTRHSIPFPDPFSNLCPLIHKMVQVKIVQMSEKKKGNFRSYCHWVSKNRSVQIELLNEQMHSPSYTIFSEA